MSSVIIVAAICVLWRNGTLLEPQVSTDAIRQSENYNDKV